MVTIDLFASLNMVKPEVDKTLEQVQAEVQFFLEDPADRGPLDNCTNYFVQLVGIFKVVDLPEVVKLLEALKLVIESVDSIFAKQDLEKADDYLVALGKGVLTLQKYIDQVVSTKKRLSSLLIPTINSTLQVLNLPKIAESYFFKLNTELVRPYAEDVGETSTEELEKSVRRLRHMFQVGLLGVIKDGHHNHLQFLDRSLNRIDQLSGRCPMGVLWWVALAVVEAMVAREVEMTKSRVAIFSKIDRQLKRLVYDGLEVLQEAPPEDLIRECVYLLLLSPETEGWVGEVKTACSKEPLEFVTDNELQHGLLQLNGPGEEVMGSVSKVLKEELSNIEDQLDLSARGADLQEDFFSKLSDDLKKVAQTMMMLGLSSVSDTLQKQSDEIAQWNGEKIDPDSDAFQGVAHSLLLAESAISGLIGGDSGERDQGEGEQLSLSLLEEAQKIVVSEARAGLALVKRSVSSYIDTHWDKVHLKDVPTTMSSIWGGALFLNQPRVAAVVKACDQFFQELLERNEDDQPSKNGLETLADAMTSIDYYLESIEENQPIGESVLDLAEDSMKELGMEITFDAAS